MKQLLITIAAVLLVGCGPSASERTLFKAAGRGNIKVAKQAIADGANVNTEFLGKTPLHSASGGSHKQTINQLIAKGADVNAEDDEGKTPLDVANIMRLTEIADLLRKHGSKTGEELKAAAGN